MTHSKRVDSYIKQARLNGHKLEVTPAQKKRIMKKIHRDTINARMNTVNA